MAELRTESMSAHGLTFHYLELGEGPLVLCLHGFPDNAYTYRYLLPVLAVAGCRRRGPVYAWLCAHQHGPRWSLPVSPARPRCCGPDHGTRSRARHGHRP